MDDPTLNKIDSIQRCLKRIIDEYHNDPQRLTNFTIQDAIVLNLQRACESSIDLAMHIIASNKLGIPQDSRNAFEILCANKILSKKIARQMQSMVGFMNIAVHDYQTLNLAILEKIVEDHLGDFEEFIEDIKKYSKQ